MVRIAGEERYVAIEDAGRLRDALGTALPVGRARGLHRAGRRSARRPGRPVRPHPRPVPARARRPPGSGWASRSSPRPCSGSPAPGGWSPASSGPAAAARSGATPRCSARSGGAAWRSCARRWSRSRSARWPASRRPGRASAAGCAARTASWRWSSSWPAPWSRPAPWRRSCCPARVRDYSPAMLDELTSAGEVLWAGAGGLPGGDGWISLVPADLAPLLLPEPLEVPDEGGPILEQLAGGQALFFRGLSDLVGATDDTAMADLVWDLVWAGVLTNDTLAPLRTRLGGGGTHRSKPAAPRARVASSRYGRPRLGRPAMPTRTGPPTVAGRWSRLPDREANATRRTTARTEALLERHGVLTRGAVMAEQVVGGFSAVYPVLRAFEENNRARRGYFVETLGRGPVRHARVDRPAAHASPHPTAFPAVRSCWPPPTRRTSTAPRCRGPSGRPPATPRRSTSARAPAVDPEGVRAPRGAQGRRAGRAGRRRTGPLRRAGRQDAAVVDRGRARPQGGGDGAVQRGVGRSAGPDGRAEGRRRDPCTPRRRCRPRCRRPGSPRPRAACACAPDLLPGASRSRGSADSWSEQHSGSGAGEVSGAGAASGRTAGSAPASRRCPGACTTTVADSAAAPPAARRPGAASRTAGSSEVIAKTAAIVSTRHPPARARAAATRVKKLSSPDTRA